MNREQKRKSEADFKKSALYRIHKKKIDDIKKLETRFWLDTEKGVDKLLHVLPELEDKIEIEYPENISSRIFGCIDGVILIRYKDYKEKNNVEVMFFNITVNDLLKSLAIPIENGEVIIDMSMFREWNKIYNSTINGVKFEFLEIGDFKYENISQKWEDTLTDFKMFLLGNNLNFTSKTSGNPTKDLIKELKQKALDFLSLLNNASAEEEIQKFLKNNPFLLQPYSQVIPKQKLGEDFITDFVLVNILDQGYTYTFVEIEKASMPIFTKNSEFSSEFKHAEKQTFDWDIWLERNKSYLEKKLIGLETPKFLIIAGRSTNLNDNQKALLRAWNRRNSTADFYTYDDLLTKTNELIKNLEMNYGS
ncbi:Shedu anti-phage system protein SduA domain-containing protein [Rufibacter ruber]|uniref:Shedu anti-phage system protein SduA domain-containing protein n=1 Tax=Rufibacter ruber TaxID=1783499 RepID=UPI00083313CA|nr:Shedu anti-phage system protein SduA domain-containing protein [Rufibacter ruber]